MSQQINRKYKEELDTNFRSKNYNNWKAQKLNGNNRGVTEFAYTSVKIFKFLNNSRVKEEISKK